jgi:F0F1-type ATP synthase membrane subunit c/vacuolar-type H+-ATPase subunit K
MHGGHKFWRDTAILALTAAAVRLIFLQLLPAGVASADLHSWQLVAAELRAGRNPYHTTPFLNWPPLWMQIIAAIDNASQVLRVSFATLLRLLLIAADVTVVIAAHRLAVFMDVPKARAIVLFGLALNPISVFLVCQHANFDTIVALAVLLGVSAVLRFARSEDPVDWLYAALAIGIGTLAKTIPIILIPLLSARWKTLNDRTRVLGALLLVGPVALGLSIVFALAPQDILQKVIQYRSFGGTFGVSGILAATVVPHVGRVVRIALLLALGTIVVVTTLRTARRDTNDSRSLILLGAFLLIGIILLGPGYGPQYIAWFLPLLVLTATSFDAAWRRILMLWGFIAVLTYLAEYLLLRSHGALLIHLLPQQNFAWATVLATPKGTTLLRLPLFVAYCALWIKAGTLISRSVD